MSQPIHVLRFASILVSALILPQAAHGDQPDVFGNAHQSEAALIGVMYDLKQTQTHGAPQISDYSTAVDEFLTKHWDEAVLNRYYRVSRPLYTTQIFIPLMDAALAPKAFGAEQTVKPSGWVIHYKGEVSAPVPGTYRFWGCADDVMAVAVNGKTELVSPRPDTVMPKNGWKPADPAIIPSPEGDDPLRPGDWFTVKAGEIIDLDVIIGERPGGAFDAFLQVEQQGASYQKDAQGYSILPIFQVAAFDTPEGDSRLHPKFAKGSPPWKSYQ